MAHLRFHHAALMAGRTFTSPITCGQDGCLQTFRYSSTFKRHIENKHKARVYHGNEGDNDDENFDDFDYADQLEVNIGNQQDCNAGILTKAEVTELAACTVAKMKASSSVVQSTVDSFVSDSSELFSQIITSLKRNTELVLERKDINNIK